MINALSTAQSHRPVTVGARFPICQKVDIWMIGCILYTLMFYRSATRAAGTRGFCCLPSVGPLTFTNDIRYSDSLSTDKLKETPGSLLVHRAYPFICCLADPPLPT